MKEDSVDTEVRVRYAETDQMGIAYYGNYLVWFEVGRSEYCRKKDFSYAALEKQGYRLVVTEVTCQYRNAARYDEVVTVRTRLKALNKRMITFGYQMLRKNTQQVVAEGETKHLCLDASGKPRSLPKEFLIRLAS